MDSNRCKTPAPSQSATSHRVGSVEPGDGSGTQLRIESGERLARPAPGATGSDAATTVAGVVLAGRRQSRQDPSLVGGGNVFCPVTAALVLAWWPEEHQELALALDATTLGQRFTVLCISVLVCGCAIPVAWKVLAYNQKGSWQPYWHTLLAHLDGVIPAEWTVLVLADRGLYAPWLYRQIVAQGWHPFLRINAGAKACVQGSDRWEWITHWLPA